MKTYIVPMKNGFAHHNALIEAENKYTAMIKAVYHHNCLTDKNWANFDLSARGGWTVDMNYNEYEEYTFTPQDEYDKLSPSDSEEDEYIELYNYTYWGDYNAQIQSLVDKALSEKWSFENKFDNGILKNYLDNTFIQLQKEGKIIETDTYCLFNTGLFTEHYIPIYAYGELNKKYTDIMDLKMSMN